MARSKGKAKIQSEQTTRKTLRKNDVKKAKKVIADHNIENDVKDKENIILQADKQINDVDDWQKDTVKINKIDCEEQKMKKQDNDLVKNIKNENLEQNSDEKNENYNDEIIDEGTINISDENKQQIENCDVSDINKKMRSTKQNKSDICKQYNIEKLLDSGKVINMKKTELKNLIAAKNKYKADIKNALNIKKKEIIENLKSQYDGTIKYMPNDVKKCPYISFPIGIKNTYNGKQIITKSKIDYKKKKPSVMIKIGNETIVIDDKTLDKQNIAKNDNLDHSFIDRVKSLYQDYYGKKKLKK